MSQAFCSAMPVSYSSMAPREWRAFATLTLEAAYEATMWAAAVSAQRGRSNIVLLTSLGGGAFGNDTGWIECAIWRSLRMMSDLDLDVRLVSFGDPPRAFREMASAF